MLGKYAHQWDPSQPEKLFDSEHHGTKVKFHQLISDPSLAELEVGYDVDKCQLQLSKAGKAVLDVCLTSPEGAADAEAFFESYLGDAVKASDVAGTKLRLVSGEGQKHQVGYTGETEPKFLCCCYRPAWVLRSRANAADMAQPSEEDWGLLSCGSTLVTRSSPMWVAPRICSACTW
jgi:hypothetical protein